MDWKAFFKQTLLYSKKRKEITLKIFECQHHDSEDGHVQKTLKCMKSLSDMMTVQCMGSIQGANYRAVSEIAWNFSSTAPC
jgi:hypothetical protein